MIRVKKSLMIPDSLTVDNPSHYDGQDVQDALVRDQNSKCYLCEQHHRQNFQIEHLKPQVRFTGLKFQWTNLFSACPYCNGRKPDEIDILDPSMHNIEEFIMHRLNLTERKVEIDTIRPGSEEDFTVILLSKLFNGKKGIRDIKCQMLYDDLERELNFFLKLLFDYKRDTNDKNKQKVIDSLLVTKEYLAFKYWILKDVPQMFSEFKDYITWNRN